MNALLTQKEYIEFNVIVIERENIKKCITQLLQICLVRQFVKITS